VHRQLEGTLPRHLLPSLFPIALGNGLYAIYILLLLTDPPPKKEADSGIITLEEVDDAVVEAVIHFMYHFDYSNTQGVSTMVFHAQVYCLADRYMMAALKQLAKDKFEAAVKTGWSMDDFLLAVDVVYSSSPEGDRGLRDLVVEVSSSGENLEKLLKSVGFRNLLSEKPGFAADIIIIMSSSGAEKGGARTYRCPSCGNNIKIEWQEGSYFYCVHCSARRMDWASYRIV